MVATVRGGMRQLYAIKNGLVGRDHGASSNRTISRRLADSVLGELGELAVSRATGLEIMSAYGDTASGDIEGGIEVRATEYRGGHLLLHDSSPNDLKYVLVVISGIDANVCGWITASDGKLKEYWRKGNPDCYYVPQEKLLPIESIKEGNENGL